MDNTDNAAPSGPPSESGTPVPRRNSRPDYKPSTQRASNKVTDINGADTASIGKTTNAEKCNGMRASVTPAKDRWGKLKTTMATTNAIAPKRKTGRLDRGDSFLRKFSTRNQAETKEDQKSENGDFKARTENKKRRNWRQWSYVISPSGGLMFYWLGVVTIAVMYNLWTCIAREAFREIQEGYMTVWFCMDGLCDFIYICDVFVQLRTGYLQQGLMVYDSAKLCKKYIKDRCFLVDVGCLLPLDFLQFYVGIHPMLRFPRFLKVYRSLRFMHLYESRTAYPNLLRVANLSHILFLGSHWFAAFYYLISEAEGFDGDWSYPKPENQFASVTRKYLASMYWSTLTLTTIGDLPPPDTNWQYVFVIVSYLIGVFIFATIVGQVGNVITNRNASRQEFERLLDGAKFYMQMHNVPPELQRRVQRWYDYVWTRGRLNCNDINSLGLLPDKLKTELALHVNLGTLKKVTIFQKCRPEFLHDLMLKMRAYIFTPGDLICRRGEVAREMFIIADGVVEILGENATVLTQMSTGDFFGEIGILNLDGGINRRTADVRSVGYSELFVLSREDVLAALKDHPDAEQIIREYGQRRLRETVEHRKMARSTPTSPDPSSAWGPGRHSRKNGKRDQHKLVLPNVKCLQKIPQMSPKLKKLFHRKRADQSDKNNGKTHEKCEKGETNPIGDEIRIRDEEIERKFQSKNEVPTLEIIQEKGTDREMSVGGNEVEDNSGAKSLTLASLVLNLIKNKRQAEYAAVHSSGEDTEDEFSSIKVDNLGDIVNGVGGNSKTTTPSQKCTDTDINNEHKASDSGGSHFGVSRDRSSGSETSDDARACNRQTVYPVVNLPRIVLTKPNNITNSDSSSDSSNDEEHQPPTPHPARKSYLSRKSSPCIPSLSPEVSDRLHPRISLPPPLDLPLRVVSGTSISRREPSGHPDMLALLEDMKTSLERRLDAIESSYTDSLAKMEQYILQQQQQQQQSQYQQQQSQQQQQQHSQQLTSHVNRHHTSSQQSIKFTGNEGKRNQSSPTADASISDDTITSERDPSNAKTTHQCDIHHVSTCTNATEANVPSNITHSASNALTTITNTTNTQCPVANTSSDKMNFEEGLETIELDAPGVSMCSDCNVPDVASSTDNTVSHFQPYVCDSVPAVTCTTNQDRNIGRSSSCVDTNVLADTSYDVLDDMQTRPDFINLDTLESGVNKRRPSTDASESLRSNPETEDESTFTHL